MINSDVIIIGAGAAGLASAASMGALGLNVMVLEKANAVGSVWRRHYDRLHLHTDRGHSGLPGMAMPRTYPTYPSREQVVEYLESYAAHFRLHPVFNTTVLKIARNDSQWIVDTNKAAISAPVVVIATGWADFPNRPVWPGSDTFQGTLIHSSEYRNTSPYIGKRVYLGQLKEVVPKLSRVGVLGQVSSQVGFTELEAASRNLSVALEVADLRRPEDIDGAFATMISKRVEALLVVVGPLTYLLRQEIADAALKHRLPAMTNAKQFAQAGLLMSYGPDLDDLYRRAAIYVDKILSGAVPADLPVEQPTKFELVINLKTAKALGLDVPLQLQQLADEVIE